MLSAVAPRADAIQTHPACSGNEKRGRGGPLLPVRGVVALLGVNEDRVIELIEAGKISYAFDLGSSNGRTREIRILPAAVADLIEDQQCSRTWPQVVDLIIPRGVPTLSTPQLALAFNVSATHVLHLGYQRAIRMVKRPRRGPTGAAQFTTASVVEFLRARLVA